MPQLSSWHVIDPSTPWLVRVKSSDTSAVEATLTNLREVYVGTCSEASVRQQVDSWGGAQPAQMLGVMHEMIDDPTFNRNAKFTVTRSGELQVLRFEVRDTTCVLINCTPSADSATTLRDELVLPLLRATEQLRALVPAAAAAAWRPPANPLPLPQFNAAPLRAMLNAGGGGGGGSTSVLAAADGEPLTQTSNGITEASSSAAVSAPSAEAAAADADDAPLKQQEDKKRKAAAKREAAAKKAAKKEGG